MSLTSFTNLSCRKKLSVARWNNRLYVFIIDFLWRLRQQRWIIVTLWVSSSREISFLLIKERKVSWKLDSFLRNIGTSSWIFLMIRRSMLLMYSLKVLEWLEWGVFLSLVTRGLAPISEASRLALRSLDTTLSLQTRLELFLFFLLTTPWMV